MKKNRKNKAKKTKCQKCDAIGDTFGYLCVECIFKMEALSDAHEIKNQKVSFCQLCDDVIRIGDTICTECGETL